VNRSPAGFHRCQKCPRLVALRRQVGVSHPDYHAAPVAAWGSPRARLLLVGLAPGMHGANRTGRPFTGDASGDFLFAALFRARLVTHPDAAQARLRGLRITNAVKCLPPGNRPNARELRSCQPYLMEELAALVGERPRRQRVVVCLGALAHDAVASALGPTVAIPSFRHGQCHPIAANVWLLDTYHPSRLNTNTGRLTEAMLDEVLMQATTLLRS